ncbi:MAG: TIM-barrel domain-containing protein, partial [Polyangiaceae bacterium]
VAEARKGGYFIKRADGSELTVFMISAGGQTVATIDMTNPDAVKFYERLLQRALDIGYDGWMLDFGEYLPANTVMFDGRTGWEMHNIFPVIYQKATSDYLRKVRGDDFMFFARAAYTGSQAVSPVVWSGDPAASFDDSKGLPAQVRAGVNAGLSGIPFWGSDVSGYTCQNDPPADKEVFLRWAAFGALSPVMEVENACSGSMSGPKWNVWSDAETTKIYGDYARLHTRLFPYLYAAAKEATLTGIPVMRHPFLVHPKSPEAYAVDLDYYFGSSLYVAPVVRRGATTRDVWLPPGRWVDWFSLEPLASGKVTRTVPLDVMPLFLKSGAIVPLLDPSIQTLVRTATDPTVVTLDSVKDVLDARAAIDLAARDAAITLTDGTSLAASLGAGALALPADLAVAATDAELSTCAACGKIDTLPSGVQRVRVSTSAPTIAVGGLTLSRPVGTQKIRWDVAVLP